MRTLYLLLLMLINVNLFACNDNQKQPAEQNIPNRDSMKLKITVGHTVLTATMYYNPTSKDFVSMLPLNLTLTDYNNTEKISDLPKKLSIRDAPAGYKPAAGDITIYGPWGNLALFYKDFSYSKGLIMLGRLEGNIDVFKTPGSIQVKIELIQQE